MTITAPSAESTLAQELEKFIKKAEAWLQNHYAAGSDSEDIEKIVSAIANLQLGVDTEALEKEFEIVIEKKNLLNDYYDLTWL